MSTKVTLKVVSGDMQGQTFDFDEHDTFLFGRQEGCHARLPKDRRVSRHHFLLEVNPPDARVRDLGSRNGTFVNGVKHGGRIDGETPRQAAKRTFPCVDLKHEDQIRVGRTTIEVRVELSLSCCQCGEEVPGGEQTDAEWMPGSFLCAECRRALSGKKLAGTMRPILYCGKCGEEVSAESQQGRSGAYLCETCRKSAVAESGGVRQILLTAMTNIQSPTRIEGYDIKNELGRGRSHLTGGLCPSPRSSVITSGRSNPRTTKRRSRYS